ncbi:MAG: rhodanese-like domain-containing protein [Ignavibacteria bacterium]
MNKTLVILFITFISFGCFAQDNPTKVVTPEEFNNLISQSDTLVVLDVRTAKEFESGHIKDAVNIDFYDADFKDSLSKLDKNKTYFVYCKLGGRSNSACSILSELGFEKLYNLKGGIVDWTAQGYSVVK